MSPGLRKSFSRALLSAECRGHIDILDQEGLRIRQISGLPNRTPIVVMAEQYGVDLEGLDIKVGESEYVIYPEDGQQLMNLLHRLCSD